MINSSILGALPEFLSSQALVGLGLYPSIDAAYLARTRGSGPDFLKLGRKILYPKVSLVDFIERHLHKGCIRCKDEHNLSRQGDE